MHIFTYLCPKISCQHDSLLHSCNANFETFTLRLTNNITKTVCNVFFHPLNNATVYTVMYNDASLSKQRTMWIMIKHIRIPKHHCERRQ